MRRLWGTLFSPTRCWLVLFILWSVILSGATADFVDSPGIAQALRLTSLLEMKKTELSKLRSQIQKLQFETAQLESNKYAQEREIRKVLGYAAQGDLIFDFNTAGQF